LSIGAYASESPIDKEPEGSYTHLTAIMEEIEQARTMPKPKIPIIEEESLQKNYFSQLPAEVIRNILDMVLLYKDQLSFMLCASGYKDYAKFITKTHICDLNRRNEDVDQFYYLDLLNDLKYLWITNCDILSIKFNTSKL